MMKLRAPTKKRSSKEIQKAGPFRKYWTEAVSTWEFLKGQECTGRALSEKRHEKEVTRYPSGKSLGEWRKNEIQASNI